MIVDCLEDALDVPSALVGVTGIVVGEPGFTGFGVARAVAREVENEQVAFVRAIQKDLKRALDRGLCRTGILQICNMLARHASLVEVLH